MAKIGLIAGGGALPFEFVRSAKKKGDTVVVFAIRGMALSGLEKEADKTFWMDIGEYGKFGFLLIKERIRNIALIGKIDKSVIYDKMPRDKKYLAGIKSMKNKKDYTILRTVTEHLGRIGVKVTDGTQYLSHLIPGKGPLCRTVSDARVEEDIQFGYDVAKKLADMDVGQTVVVKDKTVVAVEAMEGTDAVIARAGQIAGEGCVMVKVSRPNQDMRWDVPTVGLHTMTVLAENSFSALAIESDRTFLLDREKFVEMAEKSNIAVKVL